MRLTTTVIGSLPRLHEDLDTSIRLAVDLQVKTGIDIVSDGEQRTDMILYLSNSMRGLGVSGERVFIAGEIKPLDRIEESFKIIDFIKAREYIVKMGYENRLKIGITGPVTFGFSAAMINAGPYGSIRNMELYRDIALTINKLAKHIQSLEGFVQIDEPGISAGFLNPSVACDVLDIATDGLDPRLTSIHVCGRLSRKVIDSLSRIRRVSYLNLEFAGSPGNIELVSRLAEGPIKIGVGCMRVNVASEDELTNVEEASRIIGSVASRIGWSNISYIHPDCGLRRTSIVMIRRILENLVKASRQLF
ncbi:MAG: hypothetical protein ACUVQ0_05125 [Thermoproteota archaeon]